MLIYFVHTNIITCWKDSNNATLKQKLVVIEFSADNTTLATPIFELNSIYDSEMNVNLRCGVKIQNNTSRDIPRKGGRWVGARLYRCCREVRI